VRPQHRQTLYDLIDGAGVESIFTVIGLGKPSTGKQGSCIRTLRRSVLSCHIWAWSRSIGIISRGFIVFPWFRGVQPLASEGTSPDVRHLMH
jgi:hypothetical protein